MMIESPFSTRRKAEQEQLAPSIGAADHIDERLLAARSELDIKATGSADGRATKYDTLREPSTGKAGGF
jgi:hypothetical protein